MTSENTGNNRWIYLTSITGNICWYRMQ